MIEDFLPIPSLDNQYEINSKGVVRNVKNKKILSPFICFQSKKQHATRTVASLLLEVHGIKKSVQNVYSIECSCSDGKGEYHFQTLREMAKFLAPKTHYARHTVEDYLSRRKSEIGTWKIKYFDEPKNKSSVTRGNFGKKYNKRKVEK